MQADAQNRSRIRRQLAHAFSEKALREREHHIIDYVDVLVEQLKLAAIERLPVDMVERFSFATIDIISKLAFRESLNTVRSNDFHEWVKMQPRLGRYLILQRLSAAYPILSPILRWIVPKRLLHHMAVNRSHVTTTVHAAWRRVRARTAMISYPVFKSTKMRRLHYRSRKLWRLHEV